MNAENTCTLTEFQNNAHAILQKLKETGQPQLLTVNAEAEMVIQDADSYRKLLAHIEHLETIEGIQRGLDSMKQNKGRPAEEVFNDLEQLLGIQSEK